MPIYSYKCPTCKRIEAQFLKIDERGQAGDCPKCKVTMERILDAPMVRGDLPGYECPVTGAWIEGRRAHEENLKRTGCRVYESGEKEQMLRRKAAESEAQDDAIGDSAAQAFEAMPVEKRDAVAAALDNGLDVSLERRAYAP